MTLINSRTVRGRCPTCGEPDAACGTASASVPVDEQMEVAAVGGPLQRYEVTTPSGVKTTMKLNDADAKRLGVLDEQTDSNAPAEDEQPTASTPSKAARSTRNKARTAPDKGDG